MCACAAVRAPAMYDAIANHKVTHLCGAPIVMSTLLNAPANEKKPLPHVVEFFTAAAPPPEAVLAAMKDAGFNVTHLYGLTECYGPAVVNDWHFEWDKLDKPQQAARKARQGVRYGALEALEVMDPDTMQPVPRDGETLGEVMMRGNVVMKGYLKNPVIVAEGICRRLVPYRRSRRDASGRLYPAERSLERHHHFRRREYLVDRSGRRALQASGRAGGGGGGEARRQMGRDAHAPLSNSSPARPRPPTSSSPGARKISPATRCRATWCSRNCRKPIPARSRNSNCAIAPRPCDWRCEARRRASLPRHHRVRQIQHDLRHQREQDEERDHGQDERP